jgi:hypothetical protein
MTPATCSDLARWCGDDEDARRDAAALAAAASHADACAACRDAYAADLALWRALAAPFAAPASLTPRYRAPRRPFLPRAAAAAVLLCATWAGARVACEPADAPRAPESRGGEPLAGRIADPEPRRARVVVLQPSATPPTTFVQSFVVERDVPHGAVFRAEAPAPARVLVRGL